RGHLSSRPRAVFRLARAGGRGRRRHPHGGRATSPFQAMRAWPVRATMTTVSPEPETTAHERALALAGRAHATLSRFLAGPAGPWTLAIVLALAAVLQLALNGGPGAQTSVVGNLLATLPLALARRRLLLAAALITLGTLSLFADTAASLTLAGIAGQ